MAVSFASSTVTAATNATWFSPVPAVRDTDYRGEGRVLAADMVFFTGGTSYAWNNAGPTYVINHNSPTPGMPAFQNILYCDGHVEGKGPGFYANILSVDDSNNNPVFSLQVESSGAFLYWGGSTNTTAPVENPPAGSGSGGGGGSSGPPPPPPPPPPAPPQPIPGW